MRSSNVLIAGLILLWSPALASWYYGDIVAPINFATVAGTNTTANVAVYQAAPAFSVPANTLVLAAVCSSHAAPALAPTLSGQNLTWVRIASTNFNTLASPVNILTVFRSMTNALTPTGTLTATFADGNQTGCNIAVIQFGNVDTSGANGAGALVQTNHNGANATANPSVTLSALGGSVTHGVAAFFGNDVNGFAGAPEADWTEDYDMGYNTTPSGIYVCHRLSTSDNTVVVTRASADWAGVAVEIKVAP